MKKTYNSIGLLLVTIAIAFLSIITIIGAASTPTANLRTGGTADVCSLYGTTNYTNTWLGVNFLVLLISILLISVAFSLSSIFGSDMRAKLRSLVRFELIQVMISIFILGAILGFSTIACNVTAQISSSLTGTAMSPLQYADYYIGTVSLSKGLDLLTQTYGEGVKYAIDASVISNINYVFGSFFEGENPTPGSTGLVNIPQQTESDLNLVPSPSPVAPPTQTNPDLNVGPAAPSGTTAAGSSKSQLISISFSPTSGDGFGLYDIYSSLSEQYFGIFSPLIVLALGLLMIQFLIIPIVQYTAFLVILPVAIGMRSIAFSSNTLGDASNSLIALAVAFYLIYPLTIVFNAYAAGWIFSTSNPSYAFLNSAFSTSFVSSTNPYTYFSQNQLSQTKQTDMFSTMTQTLLPFFTKSATTNFNIPVVGDLSTLHYYIDQLAEFLFSSVLMFAIDIGITSMFALSLYKALKSGLGEQARFW